MSPSNQNIAVKVDASVFGKHIGDHVHQGEVLGNFAGNDVEAPFDGVIKGVSFDSGDHALIVVIEKNAQ